MRLTPRAGWLPRTGVSLPFALALFCFCRTAAGQATTSPNAFPRIRGSVAGLAEPRETNRFDAAPFAEPLPEGNGLVWDDPREIHEVVVHFAGPLPPAARVRLEYWGSRWPEQHWPKDREPGGGDVGWEEIGNWHTGGWRVADAEARIIPGSTNSPSNAAGAGPTPGDTVVFTFHPVTEKEFPGVKEYPARFRETLKIRVVSELPLSKIARWQAFTDSTTARRAVKLAWKTPPSTLPRIEVFNGNPLPLVEASPREESLVLQAVQNPDPNTFDRTLVTVKSGAEEFTFKVDDLDQGPLYLPEYGVAVLPAGDPEDYAAIERETKQRGAKTLYTQVAERPEQTWKSAWDGMPPKKSRICFPLGLDGGREKFRLDANGEVFIRWNDQYMVARPGRDSARLLIEKPPVHFRFGLPDQPVERHTEEESLPICSTIWKQGGIGVRQTAFVTVLEGLKDAKKPPAGDAFAVALLRFEFSNDSDAPVDASFPVTIRGGETYSKLRFDPTNGLIWNRHQVRGQILDYENPTVETNHLQWNWILAPHDLRTVIVKMPYLALTNAAEQAALVKLDFNLEHKRVADYWRRRLDESAKLTTPEPVLSEFYRAEPAHLLINSEFDPGAGRRFARVGSFNYGAYGNESCMMVLDLDRRGYHQEAAECLEAWLHYQGTVGLPGDFSSKEGVLYGAGGYEAGGYNQHHGWILWTLAEHYRFTRDRSWLRHAAPGLLAGADWIIRETQRTAGRAGLSRGLLPAGDLEDIGDWWTWLSTSCYTWRGLDAAAWALEQLGHPEAKRIQREAAAYHQNLIANFTAASVRSPVVRLRDGTAVPQIPSYVERRGRSFGWICQTLEGAMHLLITKAIDPRSPQASWIIQDYEDNLYLSNQYGYTLPDFDHQWFGRGGMSMQACLLLDVEPYLDRDDVKQALRALFNALAVSHFPDVHLNTEHALPEMGDWRGDHYKTSDEANVCGWLRYLFVREEDDALLLGQAVPREWLAEGKKCGLDRAATYFGPMSVDYTGGEDEVTAVLSGPERNPPREIRLRFREPASRLPSGVTVNGRAWTDFSGEWVRLPGKIGRATVIARYPESGGK